MSRVRTVLGHLLRALLGLVVETAQLVVPLHCPCGKEGTVLCGRCRRELGARPVRVDAGCSALQLVDAADPRRGEVDFLPMFPVLAIGEHRGRLRRIVLAWKNGGMHILTGAIADALAPGVDQLTPATGGSGGDTVLVPVPSRTESRVRRGEDHTGALARAIAARTGVRSCRVLSLRGQGQAGKGRRARRARGGAVRLRRRLDHGTRAVLIDDVATTGATLRACADALTSSGVEVIGALVIAGAPEPSGAAQMPPSAMRDRALAS